VYFGARWYDPEIGRFISHDPEEDGENWYSYCENDRVPSQGTHS
jgi:RHS repeat-associated protein